MNLENIRTILLDGDGVLYHADEPVTGIGRFFDVLADRKIQWGLLTNNGTRSAEDLRRKLSRFGVPTNDGMIFTSATVTAAYLQEHFSPGARIYVIGEAGIKNTLKEANFEVFEGETVPSHIDVVVSGMDRSVTYQKLRVATLLIRYGEAAFVATNPDTTFPSPDGIVPGAGSILAALTAATDREPLVMGKPASTMYQVAMRTLNADSTTTIMVGDRMDTDIVGAQRIGLHSLLVLSVISTREEAEESLPPPDLILDDINSLADVLEQSAN